MYDRFDDFREIGTGSRCICGAAHHKAFASIGLEVAGGEEGWMDRRERVYIRVGRSWWIGKRGGNRRVGAL